MSRTSRTGPRAAAPWGFLGMIALVAVVEGLVGRHEVEFTDPGTASWTHSGQAARREARDAEILCFGDSLVQLGVIPQVIESRTGRRTYNLAVTGGPPPASYFLLKRALAAGAHPAAIVLDSKPNILEGKPEWLIRNYSFVTNVQDRFDLARTSCSTGLFASLTLSACLKTYRDRLPIRTAILRAMKGESDPTAIERVAARWRNWVLNRGALLFPKNPAVADEVPPEEHYVYYPAHWSADPVNRKYLGRFLDLAASRRIPVFWVLPPISPKPQARREGLGLDLAFTRFVAGPQGRHANVTVVDGRHAGYHPKLFFDQSHLDRQGATTFSLDLAEIIARHLDGKETDGGSRWVQLPAYRDVTTALPLEDIDQSLVAAKVTRGGLRR